MSDNLGPLSPEDMRRKNLAWSSVNHILHEKGLFNIAAGMACSFALQHPIFIILLINRLIPFIPIVMFATMRSRRPIPIGIYNNPRNIQIRREIEDVTSWEYRDNARAQTNRGLRSFNSTTLALGILLGLGLGQTMDRESATRTTFLMTAAGLCVAGHGMRKDSLDFKRIVFNGPRPNLG